MVIANRGRAGGFITSEGNGRESRDEVTIISGAARLYAGTVLGKITASGKYTVSPQSGSDGSQIAVAILFDDCDPSSGDVLATIFSGPGEVSSDALLYDGSTLPGSGMIAKNTQLAGAGIKVRF